MGGGLWISSFGAMCTCCLDLNSSLNLSTTVRNPASIHGCSLLATVTQSDSETGVASPLSLIFSSLKRYSGTSMPLTI